MRINFKHWQWLFIFCAGLAVASTFCMDLMERDFRSNGESFTIIGLELTYPTAKVDAILEGLDPTGAYALRNHLYFDFIFMAGVYPGIAALAIIGALNTKKRLIRGILFAGASLQLLAMGCDVLENNTLLQWIKLKGIPGNMSAFHVIVLIKWLVAVVTFLLALPFAIRPTVLYLYKNRWSDFFF